MNTLSPLNQWYRRALPAYWVFLFCVTHAPRLEIPTAVPQRDKVVHFTAYAILAFLFWRVRLTFAHPPGRGFVFIAAITLLSYAALDEYLQLFVGRTADVFDWAMDAGGVLAMLGFLEWRRSRNAPVVHQRLTNAP